MYGKYGRRIRAHECRRFLLYIYCRPHGNACPLPALSFLFFLLHMQIWRRTVRRLLPDNHMTYCFSPVFYFGTFDCPYALFYYQIGTVYRGVFILQKKGYGKEVFRRERTIGAHSIKSSSGMSVPLFYCPEKYGKIFTGKPACPGCLLCKHSVNAINNRIHASRVFYCHEQ